MQDRTHEAIAIVGVGAVVPDAPTAESFCADVKRGRYGIGEVPRERWDPEPYWDADPRAAGLGAGAADADAVSVVSGRVATLGRPEPVPTQPEPTPPAPEPPPPGPEPVPRSRAVVAATGDGDRQRYAELGRLFVDFLDRGRRVLGGGGGDAPSTEAVVVTGAALGLPGTPRVFADDNLGRLLDGESLLDAVPLRVRRAMVDKHITRLVKDDGESRFQVIDHVRDVIKLAARAGEVDLVEQFGFPKERLAALDSTSILAIGAGLDALRDAGIPLTMRYKTTTTGSRLPERWSLPESLRDDTGVIFASAFPGFDAFAGEMERHYADVGRRGRLAELEDLRRRLGDDGAAPAALAELDRRIHALRLEVERGTYRLDRRFLFKMVPMGHAQFAETIGARGPNTQINSACASTTQAFALAEDWIRLGRCRRVVIVAADNATSDHLLEWIGSGFLASGAAATDELVEDAALPFDRRRHGMLIGMGAAGIVVESASAARERGLSPICAVLGAATANSAFHGTRLDVRHISDAMETLIAGCERRWGIRRDAIAEQLVFVSHETYTPARGGSAQAEVEALRHTFGAAADRILVANTKGYTGHPMGVGIEDVLAIKSLETGIVPPVPNIRELDPELGQLRLSQGGAHDVDYALRLGAGFGSQISFSLLRRTPAPDGRRRAPAELGFAYRVADEPTWQAWLRQVSGSERPELEIERRTLRVRDDGAGRKRRTERKSLRPVAAPPAEAPAPAVAMRVEERPPAAAPIVPSAAGVDSRRSAVGSGRGSEAAAAAAGMAAPASGAATAGTGGARVARGSAEPQPAPASAPFTPPPAPAADAVEAKLLEIVSAQTGYPPDMLDLDLDMEADLGIDTVKQAEVFAAIRKEWEIPREDSLKLRDFPTLGHAIEFVYERRPDLRPTPPSGGGGGASASTGPSAPEVTPPEPAPEPATPPAPAAEDAVQAKVLEIIAAQTGYPADMLELELDLEADLGIDTVKQAEMFAAIRKEWEIPRDDSLKLRDFPTLGHAIEFVYERRPDLRPAAGAAGGGLDSRQSTADGPGGAEVAAGAPAAAAAEPATPAAAPPRGDLEAANAVPRRVPVPVLRPALELCVETGVELGEGSRVVVMHDRGGVGRALVRRLDELGVEVLEVDDAPPAEELRERLRTWRAAGPVHGVYWLPALDEEGETAELDAESWREAVRCRVKLLFATVQELYEELAVRGRFLVAGTRLGGRHGYDAPGAVAPLGGAVSGLTKAVKRERPDALVKVVDLAPGRKTAAPAEALLEETRRDPGVVEVGHAAERRWSVGLVEQEPPSGAAGLELGRETVFVVTGAAGSIVSAITADLAAASGGEFYLLDLTPEPDPSSADLARFATDREGLKRDIFARLKRSGERATPARVEKELAGLERQEAALAAIRAVESAGGRAHYRSVNLLDGAAVGGVLAEIRERHGRVDVLVHAAGLEISRFAADKPAEQFDLVFDVKADGWHHLLRGIGEMPLGAAVVFSSVAGRFGNTGQTDYSAANDLLCKQVSHLRASRPDTLGIALDWTAWGGIGMATRGSIPKMMEAAGITMLAPEAGIPVVRREVTGGFRGELVVGEQLGTMLEELHPSGGLDPERAAGLAGGPMAGRVSGCGLHTGLVVETELDPKAQPFLDDHRIDGTPVLPGVMGIEAFAEAARLLAPERHVVAVEQVEFLAPFKFYRDEPRTVIVQAVVAADGDALVVHCQLLGRRRLPRQDIEQETVHFRARVRLAEAPAEVETSTPPASPDGTIVDAEAIYRLYFHGPAYQVLAEAWAQDGGVVGRLPESLPPNHLPPDEATVAAPRLVELCFQTAGIWEMGKTGVMGLPHRIGRVRLLRAEDAARGRLHAVVVPRSDGSGFDARVVDGDGAVVLELEAYRTVPLPTGVAADALEPLRAVVG